MYILCTFAFQGHNEKRTHVAEYRSYVAVGPNTLVNPVAGKAVSYAQICLNAQFHVKKKY
jgi:hypothetical protein